MLLLPYCATVFFFVNVQKIRHGLKKVQILGLKYMQCSLAGSEVKRHSCGKSLIARMLQFEGIRVSCCLKRRLRLVNKKVRSQARLPCWALLLPPPAQPTLNPLLCAVNPVSLLITWETAPHSPLRPRCWASTTAAAVSPHVRHRAGHSLPLARPCQGRSRAPARTLTNGSYY